MIKRIIAFALMLAALVFAATSCDYADNPKYESITYREGGLELTLKNDMRRSEVEDYDFYFKNLIGTVVLSAKELSSKDLADVELGTSATAGEYVDALIEKQEVDRERIYYSYDELRGHYSFRYSIGNEESGVFYYVVVLGEPGNIWYVEMICSESDSGIYIDRFDEWKSMLRTYSETE